jgi:ureidoacrylate peracid hydrolase
MSENTDTSLPAAAKRAPSRRIKLDAKPGPVEFDTAHTAVLVVDMQNDFGAKGGMFDRAGIDITRIQNVVAPITRTLTAARQAGMRVIYLMMGYRPDLSDLGAPGSVNRTRHMQFKVGESVRAPDGSDGRILVRDTWNTAIVDELKPREGDLLVWKTRFSGFYQTSLHDDLQRFGCRHLIVTGCTTSICVESTVRDAMFRDYLPVLLSDCMHEPIGGDLSRSNHDATLLATEVLLGWVTDSKHFIDALG